MVQEELNCGDTVLEDIAKTGVAVIVTSSALMQLGAELENKNVELNRRGSSANSSSADSSGSGMAQGIGIVKSDGVLDDIGMDAAGGFVGAAGEAVGVEDASEDESGTTSGEKGRVRQKGRPHIRK